jgi:hypothetical protein
MEILALIMVVLAAVVAVYLQREMMALQYVAAAGGGAASLTVLYSTRVVTPGGVFPAAIHVFNGRVQSVVPSDKPPKNTKVGKRLTIVGAIPTATVLRFLRRRRRRSSRSRKAFFSRRRRLSKNLVFKS